MISEAGAANSRSGGSTRLHGSVVRGLAPCRGYSLWTFDEVDGDGVVTPAFFARSVAHDVLLQVGRFDFDPTQERFNWLVESGFPAARWSEATGVLCPWNSIAIDLAIDDAKIEQARAAA